MHFLPSFAIMILKFTSAILIVICLVNASLAQTYSNFITDKEVTVFFKQLTPTLEHKVKNIDAELIDWTEPDLFGELDTIYQMGYLTKGIFQQAVVQKYFSKDDLKFVTEQFHDISESVWHAKDFLKYELVDTMQYRKILSHSYNNSKVGKWYAHSFSMPLFSVNKNYVIIQQEYYCGYMCMRYCVYLYEKNTANNTWKEIAKWKCLKA